MTRRSPKTRLLAGAFCLLASLVSTGCDQEEKDEITLQVGPEEVIRFEVTSGFAHYYELPGQDDILRIILASYPLSCETYRPPNPGDVFITVTVRAPSPQLIEPGKFPWEGLEFEESSGELENKNEEATPGASALPFVRLAEDARSLPPGGELNLTKFEPETFGLVEGELAFRDAETGQAANTALMGHFAVRLCHLGLDPARRAPEKLE